MKNVTIAVLLPAEILTHLSILQGEITMIIIANLAYSENFGKTEKEFSNIEISLHFLL